MKRVWIMLLAITLLFGTGMLPALAGNGNGGQAGNGNGNSNGARDGSGPIHDILAGEPFVFTGDVVSCESGGGMVLDLGDTTVTIYGVGPERYWDQVGVAKPQVGETITAEGYTVDYDGVERNIVMTITVADETVQLRDPDTGAPLWRGPDGNRK